jgi:multisubunit Na+/H+ antiporter MnhG subunit
MGWDIRLPIGGLFTVLGILLSGYGLFGSKDIYERSLGININLVWGIPMLVFGVAMIMLARRASRSTHLK